MQDEPSPRLTGDWREVTNALLVRAIGKAKPGNRNATGFDLACQLRDAGVPYDGDDSAAVVVMYGYWAAIDHAGGDHPYTQREAASSLASAYSREARDFPEWARKAGRQQAKGQEAPAAPLTGLAALASASRLLGTSDDPLVEAYRGSNHLDAALTAHTRSGLRVRWDHQRDMLSPTGLIGPVLAAGLRGPQKLPLKSGMAMSIYRLLVAAVETIEVYDACTEMQEWLDDFLAACTEPSRAGDDAASLYLAARDLQEHERSEWPWNPPVLLDSRGRTYIRRQDFADYLRQQRRETISWADMRGRLAEIGWTWHDLQIWEPDTPRAEAGKAKARTFRREADPC